MADSHCDRRSNFRITLSVQYTLHCHFGSFALVLTLGHVEDFLSKGVVQLRREHPCAHRADDDCDRRATMTETRLCDRVQAAVAMWQFIAFSKTRMSRRAASFDSATMALPPLWWGALKEKRLVNHRTCSCS